MTQVLIPPMDHQPRRPASLRVHTLDGATMGTTWSVKIAGETDLAALRAAIQRELDRVVAQMSPWEAGSDLCRFNAAPSGTTVALPDAMAEVVTCALVVAEMTGGAFDPTLGALSDAWGFGPAPFSGGPPDDAEIRDLRQAAGWRRLRLAGCRLTQPGGVHLDLNGVAKGYAVDRLAGAIEQLGVTAYLAEVGGELRGRGLKPDGMPWWVELESPGEAPDDLRTLVGLVGLSAATSGGYRRFFDHHGRRFTHTLDPRDGRPVDDRVLSVSVLHAECMWADALATALLVMGEPQAMAFAAKHAMPVRIVSRADNGWRQTLSPAMAAMAR